MLKRKHHRLAAAVLLLTSFLTVAGAGAFARQRVKAETIEATALGSGTQAGRMFNVSFRIFEYSSEQDRQLLVNAFNQGRNQGLVDALSRMRPVGRIAITGTLGYDVTFIRMTPTPNGRKIRFVTNRPITFGEALAGSLSEAYNLSAGEFDIDDRNNNNSSGVLYPAAQFVLDRQGELQLDLNQNPWHMMGVIDWKGTPGVN